MLTPLKKQITEIIKCDFGILDNSGNILIALDNTKEKTILSEFNKVNESILSITKIDNYLYYKIKPLRSKVFYVYMESCIKNSETIIKLIGLISKNYIKNYFEKHDKSFFVKGIVQNQLSINDIETKSKEYKIENEINRVIILIKNLEKTDYPIVNILNNLFHDKKNNYVVALDNSDIIYVMEVDKDFDHQTYKIASIIISTIEEELLIPVVIGVGKISNRLDNLFESYRSAKEAYKLGGIFESDKRILQYNKLGIGIFINKLNKEELEQFLEQIVDVEAFLKLDEEIIKTVQKFFENNLNISETARQMYLHRNTLVYRIEKVLRQIGLDVRTFEDAVFFKTAYMVKSYLEKLNDNT